MYSETPAQVLSDLQTDRGHFGGGAQCAKEKEKTVFDDRQKTLDFLRSAGLLNKTLVPTQSSIAALLSDPSVPEESKARLRALGRQERESDLQITEAE